MWSINVKLMSEFSVEANHRPLQLASRPAQSLFAYLALNVGKEIRREKLAGLFWPDMGECHARSRLRHAVWEIRKSFDCVGIDGRLVLPDRPLSLVFVGGVDLRLDVLEFIKPTQSNEEAEQLMHQIALYGEFLPGFNGCWDEWTSDWRNRLELVYLRKAMQLIDLLVAQKNFAEAIEWLQHIAGIGHEVDSLQSKLHGLLAGLVEQWELGPVTSSAFGIPQRG